MIERDRFGYGAGMSGHDTGIVGHVHRNTHLEHDWAFGNLGFGFHNWSIEDALAQRLGEVLGHRIKIAYQRY